MADPDIITIRVGKGEEKKVFQMTQLKLRSKGSVFENKFNANETLQTILLPEDNPDAFRLLYQWLFIGSIKQLPLRDDYASTSTQGLASASDSQGTPLTALERKECIKIIKYILRTNDGKNFRAPVADLWPAFADAYLAKNSYPIDLRTIYETLKNEIYTVISELIADIDLLLENSAGSVAMIIQ